MNIKNIYTAAESENRNRKPFSLNEYEVEHNRRIILTGYIDGDVSSSVRSAIRRLNTDSARKPIVIELNTPGGSATDALSIVDAIRNSVAPIYTYATGLAASGGALILAAGNRRFADTNARIMIHECCGQIQGQFSDVNVAYCDMRDVNSRFLSLLACFMNITEEEVHRLCEHDYFMWAEEAVAKNIVDVIGEPPLVIQDKS